MPWPKEKVEIHLLVEGLPSEVPHLRDFGQIEKLQEAAGFTSQQIERFAKSKKAATFLKSGIDMLMMVLLLVAGLGIGFGLGQVVSQYLANGGHP